MNLKVLAFPLESAKLRTLACLLVLCSYVLTCYMHAALKYLKASANRATFSANISGNMLVRFAIPFHSYTLFSK